MAAISAHTQTEKTVAVKARKHTERRQKQLYQKNVFSQLKPSERTHKNTDTLEKRKK